VSALAQPVEEAPLSRSETTRRLLPPGCREDRSLAGHLERYGPLPPLDGRTRSLLAEIERSGLAGRGGAGFPTHVKLRAVASRRSPVLVANGTEGEPASAKDKALMGHNPHLVIDGVLAAATAIGAREAIVALSRGARATENRLRRALAERPAAALRLVAVPDRFVAGDESALVHWLNGGPAKPTFTPPRPFEKGVGGRPTLVQNVETLANIALVARFGAEWFRRAGTDAEPGTVLATVRGAVSRPGVVETELGTPIRDIVDRCGGCTAPPQALLLGGYFGSWLPAEDAIDLPLATEALRPHGASLGARTIAVLGRDGCGIAESARIARYLAGESAGQCGPCIFGLPAMADALERIASGGDSVPAALERLPRLQAQIMRRGACHHPDGAASLVASAIRVFAAEVDLHRRGLCSAPHADPLLPTSAETGDWR
jgi:NADH:ubiquinone oxidoreductase subunit F (NADH-binding)